MRSDNIKKGIARTPHRGLLMASGVSKKNINSQNVFTHIGFKLGEDNFYRISHDDLVNWVTK